MIEGQRKNYCNDRFSQLVMQRYAGLRSDEFMMKKSCSSSALWVQCFNQAYNRHAHHMSSYNNINREVRAEIKFYESSTRNYRNECKRNQVLGIKPIYIVFSSTDRSTS